MFDKSIVGSHFFVTFLTGGFGLLNDFFLKNICVVSPFKI
jgi:hypothetical protein